MSQIFEEASTFLRKKVTEFNDVKDLTNWAGSNNLLNDSIVKTRINELAKCLYAFIVINVMHTNTPIEDI